MSQKRPLIMFTNDDGIKSPGLLAVANAFTDIADILIVAPNEQQSGMGRSLPLTSNGKVYPYDIQLNDQEITIYGVGGTPAQSVQQGVLEIAKRRPSLIISGINYGENAGNGVTISGTVGAALEGAALGIPSIAISQQTPKHLHLTYSQEVDFSVGAHFARKFALWMLNKEFNGSDIDLLKIDLPALATTETEWRITRLSRTRVYWPTRSKDENRKKKTGPLGYYLGDTSRSEPDSDVYAIFEDKVVSVTPMSLDMTSRIDLKELHLEIEGHKTIAT